MKVFVTGGTGFIGKQLVQRFLKDGHEVFVLVRTSAKGEALRQAGAQLVLGDLSDEIRLNAAVRDVDRVYHCAALTGFWGIPWKELYEVNVLGTETVMNACMKTQCPNVVHISTAFVYGFCRDARPRKEPDQAATPLPPYERSKLESENIVLSYVRDEGLSHPDAC
jgi:nucleoside-diphosphate-sugar epimerase